MLFMTSIGNASKTEIVQNGTYHVERTNGAKFVIVRRRRFGRFSWFQYVIPKWSKSYNFFPLASRNVSKLEIMETVQKTYGDPTCAH